MADIYEKEVVYQSADVNIPTTTETVVVSSGPVRAPVPTFRAHVQAWFQIATGAGTTGFTPRIRRGTATSGTLVGQAISMIIVAAAGSQEMQFIDVVEERAGEASVEYSLTVEQGGATGNGTVLQAAISVEILGG